MSFNLKEKYSEVMKEIKDRGYTHQVNRNALQVAIAKVLNVTREKTALEHIKMLENFGYVKINPAGNGIFDIIKEHVDGADVLEKPSEEEDPNMAKYE